MFGGRLRHLNGSINFALTRVAAKAQGEGVAMTSFYPTLALSKRATRYESATVAIYFSVL
jgi:hypothetical protein